MNLESLNQRLIIFGVFIRRVNLFGNEGESSEKIREKRLSLERELVEIREAFLENQNALQQQYSEERMEKLQECLNRLQEAIAPDFSELRNRRVSNAN